MYISNEIANKYNYDLDELARVAIENTMRLHPATLEPLDSFKDPEDRRMLNDIDVKEFTDDDAFVLSNNTQICGAATLFYPGAKEKIAVYLGDDFYAIPSSIHEFIIVPCGGPMTVEYLEEVLVGANKTVVKPEDILGESVLKYSYMENKLDFARDMEFSEELE